MSVKSSLWALYSILRGIRVKVKRKTEITDAVRYERGKGMEDGFLYGTFDPINGYVELDRNDPAAYQIAYVSNDVDNSVYIVNEHYYIVTNSDGYRYTIDAQRFELLYDICTIDCEPDSCPPERVARHEQTMDTIIHRLDNLEGKLGKIHNLMIRDTIIGEFVNAGL